MQGKDKQTKLECKNELAPCGVYCGACSSYNKTCCGCASENRNQDRISKWGCKIRNCCYFEYEFNYCVECDLFPCKMLKKKLFESHPGNIKFKYRHEIPKIFTKMRDMSIEDYCKFQRERWSCPSCGGIIHFYKYTCNNCGIMKIV